MTHPPARTVTHHDLFAVRQRRRTYRTFNVNCLRHNASIQKHKTKWTQMNAEERRFFSFFVSEVSVFQRPNLKRLAQISED
jgi:hypothetical protein